MLVLGDYIMLDYINMLVLVIRVLQAFMSNHLSPHKIMTILLTMFLMLYITTLWLIYL